MDELDYAQAGAEAELLAASVKGANSLESVYMSLDAAISELTASGYNPSDLLPAEAEPGIGFALNQKRNGKTLWQAITVAGRSALCDPNGDLRKKLAASSQAGALVGSVMSTLGLPLIAISMAVAIVGVILAIGIQGFCQWISTPVDEPASA
jgi:hypothetical protein